MNKNALLVLEIIWITVGVLSLVAGLIYGIKNGGSKVFVFLLMGLVSFTFAFIRHSQRKKR